ncbi:MAG: Gfo/Idh/MocA family oxidoreductase [Pseudomonadales bacterium]|nr:Gfo/Idh/MocA family oxidoreductase [Pseudomonadales bacterium]
MSDNIRVGLVGCGGMGRYIARLTQQQSNQVEICGLYDPDENSVRRTRETLGKQIPAFDSIDGLLETDCQWVMIASWNAVHAEQTLAAFAAGKHVFCQKPLATNLDDCLAMRSACRDSGRSFAIGFTLRYSPHYRKLKELISGGVIGDVISLEFNETLDFNHGGYIMGDWRRLAGNAGSHLLEKCCHDIDIVNWLVGSRASRVSSFGGRNFFNPENEFHMERLGVDEQGRPAYQTWRGTVGENPFTADKDIIDNQVVCMEFANQVRATFHINCNTAIPERRLYVCGTEGTIRSDVISGQLELQRIGFDTRKEDHATGVSGMHGEGDAVLAAELVATMMGSGEMSAGIDEGLASAVTCFAIDQAMATGQVVDLKDWWRRVDHE